MIEIPAERASSAVRCAESLKGKMELLMKAGDVADVAPRRHNNKPTVSDPEEVERIMQEALRLRKKGLSWADIAQGTPYHPVTLAALLKRRGYADPLNYMKNRQKKRQKTEALARKVNQLAQEIGLREALAQTDGITENQYHTVRVRLKLPPAPHPKTIKRLRQKEGA